MKFIKQRTSFTCGTASIKNCFIYFNKRISENKIRDIAHTTKEKGTKANGIIRVLNQTGFESKEIKNKSPLAFLIKLKYALNHGFVLILLTDHEEHWCSVLSYDNKHFQVIDPERGQKLEKFLTGKELIAWANNFSKSKKIQYFYAIRLRNNTNLE